MKQETLPGNHREQPLVRIVVSGEIVELRFSDGHIEKRTIEQLRKFLDETEERDESLLPTRIPPMVEVGDVLSWDEQGKRTYGKLEEKAYTNSQGPFLIVNPYDQENKSMGIQVTIRWSEVRTAMTHDVWTKWHGSETEKDNSGHLLIEETLGEEKAVLWHVLVERASNTGGMGRFGKIYAGVNSQARAQEIRSELLAAGVIAERISILRDENERSANEKFGALLHGTVTGQAFLWTLRLLHPRYRKRRCINASGNPKKIYVEKAEAELEASKLRPSETKKRVTYHCRKHRGWHIGNK